MTGLKYEKGFSLVEVLITLLIVSITIIPLVNVFSLNEKVTAEIRAEDTALFLAQAKLEEFKGYTFDNLENISDKTAFTGYPDYFFTVKIEPENDYLKKITVTIYYQQTEKEKQITLTGLRERY